MTALSSFPPSESDSFVPPPPLLLLPTWMPIPDRPSTPPVYPVLTNAGIRPQSMSGAHQSRCAPKPEQYYNQTTKLTFGYYHDDLHVWVMLSRVTLQPQRPDNIMVNARGVLMIADFGLAVSLIPGGKVTDGQFRGTRQP